MGHHKIYCLPHHYSATKQLLQWWLRWRFPSSGDSCSAMICSKSHYKCPFESFFHFWKSNQGEWRNFTGFFVSVWITFEKKNLKQSWPHAFLKRSKTHERLKERFLSGQNRAKRANFQSKSILLISYVPWMDYICLNRFAYEPVSKKSVCSPFV